MVTLPARVKNRFGIILKIHQKDESTRTRRLKFREVLEEHSILKKFWDYPREKQSAEYVEAAYFASCQLAGVQPNDTDSSRNRTIVFTVTLNSV